MSTKYFSIETIKNAINGLEKIKANWLIPTFVFAANGVNTHTEVDMAEEWGTDSFLDDYFHGSLMGLPPFKTGKNLLRPRMTGIKWNTGDTAGDFVVRQNTKMWGNLFSSRGYREMRLRGQIESEKSIVKLTDTFQSALEENIPEEFKFENLIVWLFAFSGFPDSVSSWQELFDYLLSELELKNFEPPYQTRFRLDGNEPWPTLLNKRPSNETFQLELATKLAAILAKGDIEEAVEKDEVSKVETSLPDDDQLLFAVREAIEKENSRSFLFAGPPGTGKTHYANEIALALTEGHPNRITFLQFHPGFGYDDFVEGFRPSLPKDGNSGVVYKIKKRHLIEISIKAKQDPKNLYVMVIDELNRGDVSRIFGEMLTYIELAYREKNFTLALSGENFSLPRNLVFITTANPFDRSVTELDDALLRRFNVFNFEPDPLFLASHLRENSVEEDVISKVLYVFTRLNETFTSGFGHTNFLKVKSVEDLADTWEQRVKLGLKRTLLHDKDKLQNVISDIEKVLSDEKDETESNAVS